MADAVYFLRRQSECFAVAVAALEPMRRGVFEAPAKEIEAVLINDRFGDSEAVEKKLPGRAKPGTARNIALAGIPLDTDQMTA